MIEVKKITLASQEARLKEIEKINKFSNFSFDQKKALLDILDELEKVIKKIQEINFNKEFDYPQKEAELQELDKKYTDLQIKYEMTYAEFESGKSDELGGNGRKR